MRSYLLLSIVTLIVFFGGCSSADNAFSDSPVDLTASSEAYRDKSQKLPGADRSPIGMNVNAVVDWSTSYPFVNIVHSARPFYAEREGTTLTKDAQGWVTSKTGPADIVSPMLWVDDNKMLPKGDYTVMVDGELDAQFGCTKLVSNDRKTGRKVIRIGNDQCGLYLKIKSVNPKNPPKNLRIVMPGGICEGDPFTTVSDASACGARQYLSFADHSETILFNPEFLSFMRDFSVLRFMDAQNTNGSKVAHWADRAKLSDATWMQKGMPIEVMVRLVNILHADLWVNIPHAADDDYVEKLATYIRDHLDKHNKVYIEYSNEVWNGIFPQARYALEQGEKRGLDKKNKYYAAWKFYSARSVEIFKTFENVFGGTEQLVRVMATQAVRDTMTKMLLAYKDAYQHVDVLAIAAYFGGAAGGKDAERVSKMTDTEFFDYLQKETIPAAIQEYRMNYAIAASYDLPLVAYEGGQHLGGIGNNVENKALVEKFQRANRDPRMKQAYIAMYQGWKDAGGTLYMHYAGPDKYTKWGSWGIKEYLMQPRSEAPKYDGTLSFIEHNQPWW